MTRIRFPERRPFFWAGAIALLLSTASLQTLSAKLLPPSLGTSQAFAVLGGSTVTNTGPSVITGNLGLFPGTSITGFPPGSVIGTVHNDDGVAMGAQADALTAYNALAAYAPTQTLTGTDLGGLTLTSGVYFFASSAQLTGTLTLNAQGDPNAVFIFQIGSTLTTASNSSVVMINGGSPCNVFFQIGSSATIGTGTAFLGNILASASVTLTTGATVLTGRVFALNQAVTLQSNVISALACNSGFLQVCKVAGGGVGTGTFAFSITTTPPTTPISLNVAAGAPPLGNCSAAQVVQAGTATVTETVPGPGGAVLTGVSTTPAGSFVSSNLAGGTATVTVTAGGTTTVTFIDTVPTLNTNGYVIICKVAGGGVAVGTLFAFTINGAPIGNVNPPGGDGVKAGAAPGGACSSPQLAPASTMIAPTLISESGPASLTAVSTTGGTLVSTNLASGEADVTVTAGGTTIVTFTNSFPPGGTLGYLVVCKVAGSGVTVGADFVFTINGTPIVNTNPPGGNSVSAGAAPGGTCSSPQLVDTTTTPTVVFETLPGPGGAVPTAVSSTGTLVFNLATGEADVTVTAGGTTVVTYTDAVPVALTTGFLTICKVAGGGVPVGTGPPFAFTIGTTPPTGLTVPAGAAPLGSCSAAVPVPAGPVLITETLPTTPSNPCSAVAGAAPIQAATDSSYQVKYAANLSVGDSYFDIMNTGANGASPLGPGTGLGAALNPVTGNLCANVYTIDPNEELVSCCSCLITPDQTVSLSALSDLASAAVTATGVAPPSISLKLIASLAGPGGTGTSCSDSAPLAGTAAFPLAPSSGMAAWGTTLHPGPALGPFVATETPFTPSCLYQGGSLPLLTGVFTLPGGALVPPANLAAGTVTVTVPAGGQTVATFTNAFPSEELTSLTGRCASIIGNLSGHGQCITCQPFALGATKKQ